MILDKSFNISFTGRNKEKPVCKTLPSINGDFLKIDQTTLGKESKPFCLCLGER